MRRLILEDPLARSAVWSRNLAVFALLVAVFGVVLSRKGLDAKAALAIEGGALALAGLAILFAFIAMAVIWRTGFRGTGFALGGMVLSLVLFAYPAYLAVEARTAPAVLDVSTNTDDPPSFLGTPTALAARHGRTPSPVMNRADIARQNRLYPDLQTLDLEADAADVDETVHALIKRRHWQIVDETAPVDFATGHIDVVVKPALMGFPVDLTIRIRGLGNRTKVDIRSVARSQWQEQPGANAARVQALAADIEDAAGQS